MQRGASNDSRGDTIIAVAANDPPARNPRSDVRSGGARPMLRSRGNSSSSAAANGGQPASSRVASGPAAHQQRRPVEERAGIANPEVEGTPAAISSTKKKKKKKKKTKIDEIEEAGRSSKDAVSRVLLKQGHDELNLMGNFSSDCFNSLIDEATGLLTMFTVYKPFEMKLFYTAAGVYGFNVFARFVIGLNALLRPPAGSRLARDEDSERIFCGTWLRVIAGLILIMIEPVAGIRLLISAFEAEPPLTKKQVKELDEAKQRAINVETETAALIEEVNRKLKEQAAVVSDNDAFATAKGKLAKHELAVVEKEVAYMKLVAPLTQAESDFKVIDAAVVVQKRKFELERARMQGTETVEMQMAIFEDIPEIGIAVAFVAMRGLVDTSQSDISLFVTSLVVSLFHALKCFWSFWKLRKTIQAAELADTGKLQTYGRYFAYAKVKGDEQRAAERVRLDERQAALDLTKRSVEAARKKFEREQVAFERVWQLEQRGRDQAIRAERTAYLATEEGKERAQNHEDILFKEKQLRHLEYKKPNKKELENAEAALQQAQEKQEKLNGSTAKKLVIVGRQMVGKTHLLRRWTEDRYYKGENGYSYMYTVYEDPVGQLSSYKGQWVDLAMVDTGGSDDYDRLRPLSYPDTDVVLICYGINEIDSLDEVDEMVRRLHYTYQSCILPIIYIMFQLAFANFWSPSFPNVLQWIPEIRNFGLDVPFILVGLQSDLRRDDTRSDDEKVNARALLSYADGKLVADNIGAAAFLECSAKDNIGVEEVFHVATKVAMEWKKQKKKGIFG